MVLAALESAALATRREQLLGLQRAGYPAEVGQLPDKLGALQAAAQVFADPGCPRGKALRDQADIALLEGDVPEPNEGF